MAFTSWAAVDAAVLEVLRRKDGAAKLADFTAVGLAAKQVASALRRDVIERPRSGWYVDPTLPWQAKCAVRVGGVLDRASALDSFGLPVPEDSRRNIQVLVPGNCPRRRHSRDRRRYVVPGEDADVSIRWSSVDGRQAGWRTPLIDSLIDVLDCISDEWWIAAVDAALLVPRGGSSTMTEAELGELRLRLPAARRPLLDLVDPRAESCLETLLRLGMLRRGIGPLTPQFSPDGRRRVDFLVGARLIVEADGEAFHEPEQDAVRDADWRRRGYTVLRFGYDRIVHDLEAVLDEIAAALAAV